MRLSEKPNWKLLHVFKKNLEVILWDYTSELGLLPLRGIQSSGREETYLYLLTEKER